MTLRASGSKRPSERDVTLTRMQMAAQARNRRWHDFLCGKRDELHARVRQQGYVVGPADGPDPGRNLGAGDQLSSESAAPTEASRSQQPARWNAGPPEDDRAPLQLDARGVIANDAQYPQAAGDGEYEWHAEVDSAPL